MSAILGASGLANLHTGKTLAGFSLLALMALAGFGCGGKLAFPEVRDDGGGPRLDVERQDSTGSGTDRQKMQDGAAFPGDSASAPSVSFLSPKNGAKVSNPVLFKIAAQNVDRVRIYVNKTSPLGDAWNPAKKTTLLFRFTSTGVPLPLLLVGKVGNKTVATDQITITVKPDPCEDRFFVKKFDANNLDPTGKLDLVQIRESGLSAIKKEVTDLQACGANVTLGGLLSLLYYEGLFRAAAFNTKCEENSYYKMASGCDKYPEALYSYQFGLAPIHTSNFHPCKGGSYTQKMRQRFLLAAAAAGFSTSTKLIDPTLVNLFKQVCPSASPSAVDYYLLGAHSVFGVPTDSAGNHLAGYGKFPLFDTKVIVTLTFAELKAACLSITSDRKAITVYGGADKSYATVAKQDKILSYYKSFKSAYCP